MEVTEDFMRISVEECETRSKLEVRKWKQEVSASYKKTHPIQVSSHPSCEEEDGSWRKTWAYGWLFCYKSK